MSDERTRERALDPAQSFIVQAPAGSGKTELLIQRYLTLLATVDEPEQIVAITFTRKAAAEMRSRVAAALLAAEAPRPAMQPHEQKTSRLATAVLQRDAARGWQLSLNPDRLRIDTLDALNAWLARRLPVLAGGVAGAGIVEDAAALYAEAARRTLDEIHGPGKTAASLAVLLGHLDNDFPRLEAMLTELLPRRDQWLPYFASGNEGELRAVLERALRRLVTEELETARTLWPPDLLRGLVPLLAHAARHADGPDRAAFAAWLDADRDEEDARPGAEGQASRIAARLRDHAAWRGLANLLLTRKGQWRRRADKRLGFGPGHSEQRRRLEEVLEVLAEHDELHRLIVLVRSLPEPVYSPAEWRALAALRVVLRRAAAELRIVFTERQTVDFVELALSAQAALGSAEQPSELLLALDRRIRHLLVDEFQDTSHSQLRLLELLTAGWQPGDGRSLFLVGDPMQSIYRFRDADMSLFLRVKRFGIGSVRCEPLALERNFRSAPEIVGWVNETFAQAFPQQDDIGAGAAKFNSSRAVRNSDPGAAVILHAIDADAPGEELARTIGVIVQERERNPAGSLAVLVQSRSHLAGLHAQLRQRGLDVRARGIEPACKQQVVQDLLALTRAMLQPADRIAWLAVLRAPWCGLTWHDLAALCADDHALTVPELVRDRGRLERLSPDGRARLRAVCGKLADAEDRRSEWPLAEWIERTWISLDGPACLDDPEEVEHAAGFFAELRRASRRGDLDDPAELERAFKKPESGDEEPHAGGLEIMTIHRAKGLEFDTVVLLGLDREPRREARRALYWMQRVANDGTEELVMAPLRGAGEDDALCRFVQRAEEARDVAERTRLLYVATTRARRRLHLIGRAPADGSEPSRRSLLRSLWPRLAHGGGVEAAAEIEEQPPEEEGLPEQSSPARDAGTESLEPVLRRLVRGSDAPAARETDLPAMRARAAEARLGREAVAERQPRPEFEWAGQPAVQIGTLVHAYLHRIAETGLSAWHSGDVQALRPAFERELALRGLEAADLAAAAARVADALVGVLEDERGRWILERHEDARSELRLTVRSRAALEHVQLDRTFVAEGVRWIIDFKTGSHEGAEREAFLDSEVVRYRTQLDRYARTMAAIDGRPIRLALYFPLLKAFRDWAPEF
jgi:ATP-dependent exoDNAse (exonuclease V) beta subunit